jgi:hypothetical protein
VLFRFGIHSGTDKSPLRKRGKLFAGLPAKQGYADKHSYSRQDRTGDLVMSSSDHVAAGNGNMIYELFFVIIIIIITIIIYIPNIFFLLTTLKSIELLVHLVIVYFYSQISIVYIIGVWQIL